MVQKKAQSSLEFLGTFGIALSIILILSGIAFTYFNGAKSNFDSKQIKNIGNEIIKNVEQIYFLGEGNKVTINIKLPEVVENITFVHRNVTSAGENLLFDYLNITYIGDGDRYSELFETKEHYIRFNCSINCQSTPNNLGNYTSFFNNSAYFSAGAKTLSIESQGDWVSIDFYIDER